MRHFWSWTHLTRKHLTFEQRRESRLIIYHDKWMRESIQSMTDVPKLRYRKESWANSEVREYGWEIVRLTLINWDDLMFFVEIKDPSFDECAFQAWFSFIFLWQMLWLLMRQLRAPGIGNTKFTNADECNGSNYSIGTSAMTASSCLKLRGHWKRWIGMRPLMQSYENWGQTNSLMKD